MRRIIKLFNRIFEYILQKKQLTKSRVGRHQDICYVEMQSKQQI